MLSFWQVKIMANETEVQTALVILSGARLRNAPNRDEAPTVFQSWSRVMRDIPGDLLLQAANDIVISAEFWPTVKQVRDAAYQVRAHNGVSAAPNQFKPIAEPVIEWQPSGIPLVVLPDILFRAVEKLEAKYYDGGLPTDEELAWIDARMKPILAEMLCTA
jgi:hypothetical protein